MVVVGDHFGEVEVQWYFDAVVHLLLRELAVGEPLDLQYEDLRQPIKEQLPGALPEVYVTD